MRCAHPFRHYEWVGTFFAVGGSGSAASWLGGWAEELAEVYVGEGEVLGGSDYADNHFRPKPLISTPSLVILAQNFTA